MRRILVLALLATAVAAGSALAATGDREQHKFNAADQAAAKSAVLVRSDFPSAGWTGGAKRPDTSPPVPCANWNPKQSDLVLTGVAETDWKHAPIEIDTEAQVLQTAAMVTLDWQRTVTDPHAIPCLESQLKKSLARTKTAKFVSFKRLSFPHVGRFSRAYVTTIDVTANGKTGPIVVENVLVGTKRTEITMTTTTLKALQPALAAEDVRLARKLVARAKA